AMQPAFDASLGQFKETPGQYHTVTGHVRQIAAAAASISNAMNETSVTAERTATMAAVQAERFAVTVRRQEDIQQQVAQSMQQYQQVFSQVTQATHDLLTRMEQHLHHYTTLSAEKFERVVQTAEAHLAQATRRLGDTMISLEASCVGSQRAWSDSSIVEKCMAAHGDSAGLASSFTDLMTSLAVIFILLLVASHNNEQQKLDTARAQVADTQQRLTAAERKTATTRNAMLVTLKQALEVFAAQGVRAEADPADPLGLLVL